MARPKKALNRGGARERICQTFWQMLETNRLKDITVGSLAAAGSCNRGTFYYHFDSIDDLIYCVIEDELLAEDSFVTTRLFQMTTGAKVNFTSSSKHFRRIALIAQRGGFEMVFDKVRHIVLGVWESVCCAEGGKLAGEVSTLIEFSISGFLGVLVHQPLSNFDEGRVFDETTLRLIEQYSVFVVDQICQAQGIPRDELLHRASTLGAYLRK